MPLRSQLALARRVRVSALVVAGTIFLAGCSGAMIGDHMPTAVGGLPEGTPARPASPGAYPAVHVTPPARSQAVLTDEEQKKLEDDLIAARNRVNGGKPAEGTKSP